MSKIFIILSNTFKGSLMSELSKRAVCLLVLMGLTTTSIFAQTCPTAIIGTTTHCINGPNVTYTHNGVLGGAFTGGTWTESGVGSITAAGVYTPGASAGSNTITFTPNAGSGCSPVTLPITVSGLPTITGITTAARCFSTSAQTTTISYTGTTNAPTQYSLTWNAAALAAGLDNVPLTPITASPITIPVDANVAAATYTGTLTVVNASGCSSTATNNISLVINPLPNVTSPANSMCAGGGTMTFTRGTAATGTWSLVAGSVGSIPASSTANTVVYTPPSVGSVSSPVTATLRYTITATGCIHEKTITIYPVPQVSGANNVCVGGTSTFTFSNAAAGGTWSVTAGSGTINASTGLYTAPLTNPTPLSATITYTADGCSGSKNIVLDPLPTATLSCGTSVLGCGGTATFSVATTNATGGSWSSSNTAIATVDASGNVTAVGTAGGSVTITYTATNACGSTPVSQVVTVRPCPTTPVKVAPFSCYGYASTTAMNTAAAASNASLPFATWTAAYNYAIANNIWIIEFAPGTYTTDIGGSGSLDWGTSSVGHSLPAGMTVRGNGSLIDNTPLQGTGQFCFANIAGDGVVFDGFHFKKWTGNAGGGALLVGTYKGWTVSNCDFQSCNLGTDAVGVNMGATGCGTILNCDFYQNNTPLGTYPSSPGLPSSTALRISGSNTSDLNITGSTFSCNFNNTSGGAVTIKTGAHVDFLNCEFVRNEANVSAGGAVSIRGGSVVTFTNTDFNNNFTSGGTGPGFYGGAIEITDMSTVTVDGCNFTGNNSTVGGGASGSYGGAIYIDNSNSAGTVGNPVIIRNSQFYNNIGERGGAVYANVSSDVTIQNSYFSGNQSNGTGSGSSGGGAIYARHDATACGSQAASFLTIDGCTITGNTYSYAGTNRGAGIRVLNSSCVSTVDINNTLVDNNIGNGAEYNFNHAAGTGSTVTVTNSVICATSTVTQGNCAAPGSTGYSGTVDGALATPPLFCPSTPTVANNCSTQGSIRGQVFHDTDATPDGQENSTYLGGLTVSLYTSAGVLVATVTTAADGSYIFGGLPAGDYYVQFTAPSGPGAPTIPTLANTGAAQTDSDGNSLLRSGTISLNPVSDPTTNATSTNGTDATSGFAHYSNVDMGFTTTAFPLELDYFTAQYKERSVICNWATLSEQNTDVFEVERSKDGIRFEKIGSVDAAGNSQSVQKYQFVDANPLVGKSYYRLLQKDRDGAFDYSHKVAVTTYINPSKIVNVYPNPTDNTTINIEIQSSMPREFELSFVNIVGQELWKRNYTAEEGLNNWQVPVNMLPSGTYIIRVQSLGTQTQALYYRFQKL